MANEQIMVTFGGDLSPLGTSFRGLNKMAHGAAEQLKETFNTKEIFGKFKEGLALVGLGIGVEKLVEFGKLSLELAEHISALSNELGVSSTFLQQWSLAAGRSGSSAEVAQAGLSKLVLKLGQAKEGMQESVDAFEKNGIAITDASGAYLSSEQVFENAKKKILSIEDASQRSAIAVELFGKKGQQLIETMENFDVLKRDTPVITEKELVTLSKAKDEFTRIGDEIKTWGAKKLAYFLGGFMTSSVGLGTAFEMQRRKDAPEVHEMTPEQVRRAKELAEAVVKLHESQRESAFAGASGENKVLKLKLEQGDIELRLSKLKKGSLEYVRTETELVKKQTEVKAATLELDKKSREEKEKQLVSELKRKELIDRIQLDGLKKFQKDAAEFMPTLEAIASSGRWVDSGITGINGRKKVWQDNPFASQAKELMNLKEDASDALLWGDQRRFGADKARMDEIKSNLESAGLQTPEMTMEKVEDHLKFLREQAAGAGLKIDVED